MLLNLFLAFAGKLEMELLIAFLFLHFAVPRVAPTIDARPAPGPACSAKSSPPLLAATLTPFEIVFYILGSGFVSDDGVSSVFFCCCCS